MRKDISNVSEWCRHTKNVYGGRRHVNKRNRKNAKLAIHRGLMQGTSRLAGVEIHK